MLPHPLEDVFTIIVQPYSENDAVRTSSIIHFRPTSKFPLAVRTLPFRFRVAAWNMLGEGCRTLIGITTSWSIVECGDSIRAPATSEDAAQSIDLSLSVGSRRNLFEDMFGKAAFEELANGQPSIPVVPSSVPEVDARSLLAAFDKPAYLAQPIENIFSALIDNFLTKAEEAEGPVQRDQQDDAEDMVVDEEPTPVPIRRRTVDDDEINAMTELFKGRHTSCK